MTTVSQTLGNFILATCKNDGLSSNNRLRLSAVSTKILSNNFLCNSLPFYIREYFCGQIYWNELCAIQKYISVLSPSREDPIVDQATFLRDYLIRTRNRSSPICLSVYSKKNANETTLIVVCHIGEYHSPAVIGIGNKDLIDVYRAENFPLPDLERLFGSTEHYMRIISNVFSVVKRSGTESHLKQPRKLIILGLTESIGHFIQEEMAFVNNLLYILQAGDAPPLNIAAINSFALPVGLLGETRLKKADNSLIILPKRLDALSLSFNIPLWVVPASSAWIAPTVGGRSASDDLKAGYKWPTSYNNTIVQKRLNESFPTCNEEATIVIGTRFHSRGSFSLRLRPEDLARLANMVLNYMRNSAQLSSYKLCLILDFSSHDSDKSKSHLTICNEEATLWHQVCQAFSGIDVRLKHTLGMSLIQKLEILEKAHMGVYPFGSGMCAMAHLTSTPLVEYRPSYGHAESIDKFDKSRIRKPARLNGCYQINYDNILFADLCHNLHGFSESEYWFNPDSIAKLFSEVVEASLNQSSHALWPRLSIINRRDMG